MAPDTSAVENVKLFRGDITVLPVDAVVNAANSRLAGGGGVDGAIHRAAGPELLTECQQLGGCPTGDVRITAAYSLPARIVIHAVGPVWQGGTQREPQLLASCYRRSLEAAVEHACKSIAFPCISTGVYGFPSDAACEIAVTEVLQFLQEENNSLKVIFVCFSDSDYQLYEQELEKRVPD